MTPFALALYFTGFIGIILLYTWSTFNSCIKKRNQVKVDYSDIDIQLKRKSSLVDTLVALVREYAKHEQDTFTEVTQARSALDTSKSAGESARAENALSTSLRSLFLVVENYPKLQASENYQQLKAELTKTEDLIALYREEYNQSVQKFNTLIQTFPNLLLTSALGFKEEEFFQISVSNS